MAARKAPGRPTSSGTTIAADRGYVLRLLVERGADPLRKDERGQTAKDRAKQEGRDDIVKCLEELESGIGESLSGVAHAIAPPWR